MDAESEQIFHDLEQRHVLLQNEHGALRIERDALNVKAASLQNSVDELRNQLATSQKELIEKDGESKQAQRSAKALEDAHDDLQDRYQRRSDECDRLREDLKHQADELVGLQGRLRESQNSFSESQNQLLPVQLELTKVTRERDMLLGRVKSAEEEQAVRAREVLDLRREQSTKISDLENQLLSAKADSEEKQGRVKMLQDRIRSQEEKINEYLTRVGDLELAAATQQGTFAQESEGLKRLGDLHRKSFDEASKKVEELENNIATVKEVTAKQLTQIRERYEAQISQNSEVYVQERSVLEQRVADLEQQLQQALTSAASGAGNGGVISVIDEAAAVAAATASSFNPGAGASLDFAVEGLSLVKMHDRIVTAERELSIEHGKRREAELYLNRILKDMEKNAPLLAAQKRELYRVLESHSQLSKRLDEFAGENAALRDTIRSNESRVKTAEKDAAALAQHNSDLSSQLQHLLKRSYDEQFGNYRSSSTTTVAMITDGSSASVSAGDVIASHLLTFDNIAEIQKKNEQLVRVVRKLTADLQSYEEKQFTKSAVIEVDGGGSGSTGGELVVSGPSAAALAAALKELTNMREARIRTEELVASLIHQRDSYKSMVEAVDATLAANNSISGTPSAARAFSGAIGSPFASPSNASATASAGSGMPNAAAAAAVRTPSAVHEVQLKLAQAEEEKNRMRDRMNRLEEAERLLNENIERIRSESMRFRTEATQAGSEARFQKERSERLDEALKEMQIEVAGAAQRRLDMERLLVEHQRDCREREERINQSNETLRITQDTLRQTQVELEVTKAAENRLIAQLGEAREENKRQASFADSVRRIEAGLTSRIEEEKASLTQERDSLSRTLETLRKQVADRSLVDDQRILSLEEDLRAARARVDERTSEVSTIKDELSREHATAVAAQERSAVLERQLAVANDRLSAVQGVQVLDSVAATETAERELALERAKGEIDSLTARLTVAEAHSEEFRRISSATEATLRELRERSTVAKEAQEAEVTRLRAEIDAMHKETDSQRSSSILAVKEIEEAREQLRTAQREHAEQLRAQEDEVTLAKQVAAQATEQMELLKKDILKFQTTARSAHSNYERELQLHAQAEKDLRTSEEEVDRTKAALSTAEQKVTELTATTMRHERLLAEEKAKYEEAAAQAKEQLEGLRKTNDLLHGQVQSLSVQVSRPIEGRAAAAVTAGGESATEGAGSSSASASASSSSESLRALGVDPEELTELRKTSQELREVIRYMKRERDLLEAKLSVSEGEAARQTSSLSVTQRSLDEARAELKRELDKRITTRSEEEFARLMAEITQLNLVRESNAHLRHENEELAKRLKAADDSLKKALDSSSPLEESVRKLKADVAALEASNSQLVTDSSYWRDRLHQLVSRYNDVDPEEHRLLQVKLEETSKAVTEAKEALEKLAASKDDELATKNNEIASLKKSTEGHENIGNQLRNKLREFKTKFEELQKKLGETNKQNTELKQQVTSLTQDLITANAAAEEAKKAAKEAATKAAAATAITAAAAAAAPAVAAHTAAAASSSSTSSSSSTFVPAPPATPAPTPAAAVPTPIRASGPAPPATPAPVAAVAAAAAARAPVPVPVPATVPAGGLGSPIQKTLSSSNLAAAAAAAAPVTAPSPANSTSAAPAVTETVAAAAASVPGATTGKRPYSHVTSSLSPAPIETSAAAAAGAGTGTLKETSMKDLLRKKLLAGKAAAAPTAAVAAVVTETTPAAKRVRTDNAEPEAVVEAVPAAVDAAVSVEMDTGIAAAGATDAPATEEATAAVGSVAEQAGEVGEEVEEGEMATEPTASASATVVASASSPIPIHSPPTPTPAPVRSGPFSSSRSSSGFDTTAATTQSHVTPAAVTAPLSVHVPAPASTPLFGTGKPVSTSPFGAFGAVAASAKGRGPFGPPLSTAAATTSTGFGALAAATKPGATGFGLNPTASSFTPSFGFGGAAAGAAGLHHPPAAGIFGSATVAAIPAAAVEDGGAGGDNMGNGDGEDDGQGGDFDSEGVFADPDGAVDSNDNQEVADVLYDAGFGPDGGRGAGDGDDNTFDAREGDRDVEGAANARPALRLGALTTPQFSFGSRPNSGLNLFGSAVSGSSPTAQLFGGSGIASPAAAAVAPLTFGSTAPALKPTTSFGSIATSTAGGVSATTTTTAAAATTTGNPFASLSKPGIFGSSPFAGSTGFGKSPFGGSSSLSPSLGSSSGAVVGAVSIASSPFGIAKPPLGGGEPSSSSIIIAPVKQSDSSSSRSLELVAKEGFTGGDQGAAVAAAAKAVDVYVEQAEGDGDGEGLGYVEPVSGRTEAEEDEEVAIAGGEGEGASSTESTTEESSAVAPKILSTIATRGAGKALRGRGGSAAAAFAGLASPIPAAAAAAISSTTPARGGGGRKPQRGAGRLGGRLGAPAAAAVAAAAAAAEAAASATGAVDGAEKVAILKTSMTPAERASLRAARFGTSGAAAAGGTAEKTPQQQKKQGDAGNDEEEGEEKE